MAKKAKKRRREPRERNREDFHPSFLLPAQAL